MIQHCRPFLRRTLPLALLGLPLAGMTLSGCGDEGEQPTPSQSSPTPSLETPTPVPEPSLEPTPTPAPTPTPEPTPTPLPIETVTFPEDFQFGASIAGFQADMGCPTLDPALCTDPNSDWYVFVTDQSMVEDPDNYLSGQDPAVVGPGFWELYDEDIERAASELNHSSFRLSIEWSRIFPTATDGIEGYEALKAVANAEAIEHYHQIFASLQAHGLEPLVTLNHYTLPTWMHDTVGCHNDITTCSPKGWVDRERVVRELARYAGFVAQEFAGEVDTWATLNEPTAVLLAGYLYPSIDRTNPPSILLADTESVTVYNAMIEAHARMYDAVVAADLVDRDGDGRGARVGIVYNMTPVYPIDPNNELDQQAAANVLYLYEAAFLNAVIDGMWDEDLDGNAVYTESLADRMDYLGINYYASITVEGTRTALLPELSELTTFNPFTMGFNYNDPQGIYEVCSYATQTWGLPILITENGAQDPDDDGSAPRYIVQHLRWLAKAIEDGMPVEGYFYWTLVDNYEWNHGMDIRMGLYAVDKADSTKTRTARQAVPVYAEIAGTHTLSAELQEAYQ